MIREEQSLEEQYGDEYREYKKKVNRYLGYLAIACRKGKELTLD